MCTLSFERHAMGSSLTERGGTAGRRVPMNRARFRDHRVFHVEDPAGQAGGWYFEVREGPPHGPFVTRILAEQALMDYLDGAQEADHPRVDEGRDGSDAG